MIKINIGQCLAAARALDKLSALPASAKACYKIKKMLRLVRVETKVFDDRHQELVESLGEFRPVTPAEEAQGQQGEIKAVPPAKMQEFADALNEVADVDVEIDYQALTVEDFETFGSITARDLEQLGPCFEE